MADSEFDSDDLPDLDVPYKQWSNGRESSPTIKVSGSSDCDKDVIAAAANFDYLNGVQSPSRHTSQSSSSGEPVVIDLNAGFDGSESDGDVPKKSTFSSNIFDSNGNKLPPLPPQQVASIRSQDDSHRNEELIKPSVGTKKKANAEAVVMRSPFICLFHVKFLKTLKQC